MHVIRNRLGDGGQCLHEVLGDNREESEAHSALNAEGKELAEIILAEETKEAAENEAKDVVLGKDADLLVQRLRVSLVVERRNLAQQLVNGIVDRGKEHHLVRAGYAGNTSELINLISEEVGGLQLKDNLDCRNDERKHDVASKTHDAHSSKNLSPNVPEVSVEGIRLVRNEHDDVDDDHQGEHEDCIGPGPGDSCHRSPATVENGQVDADVLQHCLTDRRDDVAHVAN